MHRKRTALTIIAAALIAASPAAARPDQPNATPTPSAHQLAQQQYVNDRFGILLTWLPSSILGRGDIEVSHTEQEYHEQAVSLFSADQFNAREFVTMVKDAGARHITYVAKHIENFPMYDSHHANVDMMSVTGRDPLAELTMEARRQGIKVWIYYCLLDVYHPDYWPRGLVGSGFAFGRPDSGDWGAYMQHVNDQLAELVSRYQPAGVWLDGAWDKPDESVWDLPGIYERLRTINPALLIINNRHRTPLVGESAQTLEKALDLTTPIGGLPVEQSETINDAWVYTASDQNHKSPADLIRLLIRNAGADRNLLLNVAPDGTGAVPVEHVYRLRLVGRWLRTNGYAIYGTRGGPVSGEWGVSTRRGKTVFLHVLRWQPTVVVDGRVVRVPRIPGRIDTIVAVNL